MRGISLALLRTLTYSTNIIVNSNAAKELKDISDSLAVYTRGGVSITNRV